MRNKKTHRLLWMCMIDDKATHFINDMHWLELEVERRRGHSYMQERMDYKIVV